MIFGRKESVLRKGYNYDYPCIVVEQKRDDGSIRAYVTIPSGPIISGKGKSFEELCELYSVTETKVCYN